MHSEDFRPGLLVTVTGEPGRWRVAMYQDNRAAGLGEALGLIRESDGRELELGDDEFDAVQRSTLCIRCGRALVPGCCPEPAPGQRVRLISTTDPHTRLQPGDLGTVMFVDDAGTVHVAWDTGSNLGLIAGPDMWDAVDPDPDDEHPRWHEPFEETFVQTFPTDDQEDDR